MRRALLLSAVALVAVLGGSSAVAGGGANQAVLATATADDPTATRSGVQATVTGSDTVDSDNLARAVSTSCTGCRSVAIAFQAVIGTRSPSVVTPTNAAVAVNSDCTACTTFAYAYQYVATGDYPAAHFSPAAHARIARVRADAAELASSDLAPVDLAGALDELAAEFREIVSTELETSGGTSRRSVDGA